MGDHMAVFHSLRELFPQVDPRMLKAVAIEHHKDVDSAVVSVLDEVMPSMTGSIEISHANDETVPAISNIGGTFSSDPATCEIGSSSTAGHVVCCDEANGSVDSAQSTSSKKVIFGMQENVMGGLDATTSYQGMNEVLNFSSHPFSELNDKQSTLTSLDDLYLNLHSESNLAHPANEEYIAQSLLGQNSSVNININGAKVQNQEADNTIPASDFIVQNNSLVSDGNGFNSKFWWEKKLAQSDTEVGYLLGKQFIQSPVEENKDCIIQGYSSKFQCDYADMIGSSWMFDGIPINGVSSGMPTIEKYVSPPVLDFPMQDIGESFVGSDGVLEQKDTNSAVNDYNKQQPANIVEHVDTFSSTKTDLLPDLNLNHFNSIASTYSSHSVIIESLEDSIADAKNNKNDLLPSLELVMKMIGDVELLEEKAKVAKLESSVSGTSILSKVEELKEMLSHATEANNMHAGEVSGEKSILTTEARELYSRLQRLSDKRNHYVVVIEEIRQTLEERSVAAQEEIAAAEKEKNEKEASARALLDEQEKEMKSIVEESVRLQEEAEENLKLKDFLVERGRIVDTLQGEMSVICEDVSQLKRIVDERLSWSKLHRSTISSLSSSFHSSLHRSGSSSDRTVAAVESTDKYTVAEGASPVVEDLNLHERTFEMLDGSDQDKSNWQDSKEDGWELC